MRNSLLTFAVLVVLGCGSDETQPMTIHMSSFDTALSALDSTVDGHKTRVNAATDKAAIDAAESAYKSGAETQHSACVHHIEDMGGCRKDDKAPATESVFNELQKIAAELTRHDTAMKSATSTAAARSEEMRHQDAMTGMRATLRTARDTVAEDAASFSCPKKHAGH